MSRWGRLPNETGNEPVARARFQNSKQNKQLIEPKQTEFLNFGGPHFFWIFGQKIKLYFWNTSDVYVSIGTNAERVKIGDRR